MDKSVENFFTKNAEDAYASQYDKDHGGRLDALIGRWNLLEGCSGKKILDVGGGLGFLGKRLNNCHYSVIDGANVQGMELCSGTWYKEDLDYNKFGSQEGLLRNGPWDTCFCLEVLEHLSNPYNCLAEVKKLVKIGGEIYISIPTEQVWHNVVYAPLLWPIQNFEQFLGQMALKIEDRWLWDKGWPAYHFKCSNRPWNEKVMLFPKSEEKFVHATAVEMTNL